MRYQDFVKDNFHKLPADMKSTEKIKRIAAAWRKMKSISVEGSGIGSDVGSVVDSIGSLFGLGLPEPGSGGAMTKKPRRKRAPRTAGAGIGSDVGSVVDSIGSLFGLGLPEPGSGGAMTKKPRRKRTAGAGLDNDNVGNLLGHLLGGGIGSD